MFRNAMPRYEVLSEDAMATLDKGWRRLMTEIGVEFMDDRALELFRKAGQRVEDNTVFLDPDFVLEQVAKAPREFDVQARNPENNVHIGGDSMAFGAVYGPPFVRQGEVRRDATMDDFRNFTKLAQSFAVLDSAGGVICEPNDTPLDSRHLDMTYALQTLTDKIYMGNVVSGVNARDTIAMGVDPVRLPRGDRGDAGVDLADQLQLAAEVGRPDARGAVRVLRRRPARRPHAVHPDGRDVAGDHPGRAGAADRRGAVRHRALAADPARDAGDLRVVPVQHRHAVRLADVRHPRVRHRPALHRPDRPPLRAAVPHRRRAHLVAGRRRPGRLRGADDAAADVPGRRQLGDALRRLARGRPGRGLREVHRRRRAGADAPARVHARWRSTRTRWRSAPTRRSATAATSSARCTPWSASAPASTARCSRPRRTTSGGCATAATTPTPAPPTLYQKKLEEYEQPPLDDAIRQELEEYVVRRRAELGD